MKLENDIKTDIQCFVYFLFSGALFDSSKKIGLNYLDTLLSKPQELYNCFEVFTYSMQKADGLPANGAVSDYIESILEHKSQDLSKIEKFNKSQNNYWIDFLELAHKFCFDELSIKGYKVDLKSLHGCGTDAVPIFAVWTNIIELDDKDQITNKQYVLNRLIERFSPEIQNDYFPKFEEWEIEQEIY